MTSGGAPTPTFAATNPATYKVTDPVNSVEKEYTVQVNVTPAANDKGWGTNFEAAKAKAARENKDILMNFTGSDWCSWCIRLKKEVFTKNIFKQEAPKHFVLLELDFPHQKELTKEEKEQNEKLQETYEVQGYPTILLTDEEGRPYAKTGYQKGGPKAYNKHLAELRKTREARDAAFKKADAASGLDRARALTEGLGMLEPDVVSTFYKDEVAQVISLDREDTLGLKAKRDFAEKRSKLHRQLGHLARSEKTAEFVAAVDDFIAKEKLSGERLQDLMMTKLQVLGPADLDKADALLDEVIKIDGKTKLAESAAKIKELIVKMRKQADKSKKNPTLRGKHAAEPVKSAPGDKKK